MKGILGRKAGMTHIFTADNQAIPVTVIEVKRNVVLQVKTIATDGYKSLKLGYEDKKENHTIKPDLGQFKKANTTPKYFIKEIRDMDGYNLGDSIDASLFEQNSFVDVTGVSKGKGFQGSIKRHNYSIGPKSHGSKYHRGSGSLGDIRGTVKKTKKLPGHMGSEQTTIQNLPILKIDLENNAILVRGSIPGPNNSFVIIKTSVKKGHLNTDYSLVDLNEEKIKNELLEEAKKYAANVNSKMSIEEMKNTIAESKIRHDQEAIEHKNLVQEAEKHGIKNPSKLSLIELRSAVKKAIQTESKRRQENGEAK